MADQASFGRWLSARRHLLDLTQDELAKRVGCSIVTIRKIEADERRPSKQIAELLAEHLHIAPAERSTFIQRARGELPSKQLPASTADDRPPANPPTMASTDVPRQRPPSGTVTFLFTDIEGSTRLWEQYPELMPAAFRRQEAILRQATAGQGGYAYKMVGDAFQVAFATAAAAVDVAITAQRALAAEAWGAMEPVRVRMALDSGVVEERGNDYVGPLLNRTARLLATGHGGQILVSAAAYELVRTQLPANVLLRNLGRHRLKDLTLPEQVFQVVAPELPSDFPPLRTLENRRTNLPASLTTLIGREQDLAAIRNQLLRDDTRLLTLVGPPGMGKTRLSLAVAAEAQAAFADGVVFVALAPISDPELVIGTIAQALGVKEVGDQTLLKVLQTHLRDRQLLLVLDNFEQVLAAAPGVAELLSACPQLRVLATSRGALHIRGERLYPVPPLLLPDPAQLPPTDALAQVPAVALFIECTQAVQPTFQLTNANAATVAAICARVDGLPLAIELVAARVRLLPPHALLARLDDRLALLTDGPRDLPVRHQTLRSAIAWSYDLLNAGEQALYRRLGVFVGGCSLEAAEAVLRTEGRGLSEESPDSVLSPQPSVLDGLAALLDQSLLRQEARLDGEARFTMLETIHEYARDRLSEHAETQRLRQWHAEYYLALANTGADNLQGSEQGIWLARLKAEHANIRAALEWWRETDPTAALRLAVAMWRFWEMQGYLNEGRAWLQELLRATPDAPASLRAHAQHGSAVLAWFAGAYPRANELLTEALALFQELQDEHGTAPVLQGLGIVAWFQGNHAQAQAQLEASLVLFRQLAYPWGIADTLHYLGHVVLDRGDVEAARAIFTESLALFRQTGDRRNTAFPLKDLGLIAAHDGQYAAAAPLYEESLALSRAMDDTWHVADTLQRLGDVARLQTDYPRAEASYQESLGIWQKLANKGGIAEALNLLGEVAQAQHNYPQARAYYEASLALYRELGSKRVTAAVLANLGRLAQHERDYAHAFSLYSESLTLNSEIEYQPGIADGLVGLAALALAKSQPESAARLLGAAAGSLNAVRGFMPLADHTDYNETLKAVRAQLSDAAFAAAWAIGENLTLDQAIEYARAPAAEQELGTAASLVAADAVASGSYPGGLTKREVDVLRLVAQGLSDTQVAEQLVISTRTVNAHLRSIYSKLEITSRTAATRFAIEHQLA